MDLFKTEFPYLWGLPPQTSLLLSIRQQLWAISDRLDRDDVAMTKLADPHVIHGRRIVGQPFTYLSALPHQLLSGAQDLSPVVVGKSLLEQLVTRFPDQSIAQWRGTVNDQGYLYLQPSGKAIALWLHAVGQSQELADPSHPMTPLTSSSIALQYIYMRCGQLRRLGPADALVPLDLDLTALNPEVMELIGALLDVWDVMAGNPPGAESDRLALPSHQMRSSSQGLVEKFLEFEKNCCLAASKNTASLQLSGALIAIVSMTVRQILLRYWGINPLDSW
jgi:hypothetical protein